MLAVGLATIAFFGWGIGDVMYAITSRKFGSLTTAWLGALSGAILVLLPLPFHFHDFQRLNGNGWIALVVGGVAVSVVWYPFVRALELGPATVVSTIGSSFSALVVIFSVIFLNESLTVAEVFFIALVLIGVTGTILDVGELRRAHLTSPGVVLAFCAFLAWGVGFTLMKVVSDQAGWYPSSFGLCFITPFFVAYILWRKRQPFRVKIFRHWMILLADFLTTGSVFVVALAFSKGSASIVAPIAGANPVLFAVLAYFAFHDRMSRRQISCIVISLIGIVGLSIASV
jgi:drug/metabolite transporter (DMT)-like permease